MINIADLTKYLRPFNKEMSTVTLQDGCLWVSNPIFGSYGKLVLGDSFTENKSYQYPLNSFSALFDYSTTKSDVKFAEGKAILGDLEVEIEDLSEHPQPIPDVPELGTPIDFAPWATMRTIMNTLYFNVPSSVVRQNRGYLWSYTSGVLSYFHMNPDEPSLAIGWECLDPFNKSDIEGMTITEGNAEIILPESDYPEGTCRWSRTFPQSGARMEFPFHYTAELTEDDEPIAVWDKKIPRTLYTNFKKVAEVEWSADGFSAKGVSYSFDTPGLGEHQVTIPRYLFDSLNKATTKDHTGWEIFLKDKFLIFRQTGGPEVESRRGTPTSPLHLAINVNICTC